MADGSQSTARQRVAVIGSGVAGLSAAWQASRTHDVTLYEQDAYLGGHSNTVEVPGDDGRAAAIDTGFIVYNALNYPNLVRLFEHLDVPTAHSDMSFAVSLRGGELEYSGTNLAGLFAQTSNLMKPRFWRMLADLHRFYRAAPTYRDEARRDRLSLGDLLARHRYSAAFRDDHLLPMAGAIWSATDAQIAEYPAAAFIDFFANHGLIQYTNRPQWRTVVGGSREYVRRLLAGLSGGAQLKARVRTIERAAEYVELVLDDGRRARYDQVVIAAHADQALAMLGAPSAEERRLLGAFRYSRNRAVLHRDPALMPRRRGAWASWNYLTGGERLAVTYWMNLLQPLTTRQHWFVSLNPPREPRAESVAREFTYEHPLFDLGALDAQRGLANLQGRQRTWFCGSYFGYGFHEDALEAGLWVGEALSGVARPWTLEQPSSRTGLPALPVPA